MNLIHNAPMRSLPPFDGLVALDATLRLGSVTRAAAELGLTQSAISHRLRKLEAFMGVALTERTAIGVTGTAAGQAVAAAAGKLLDGMADLRACGRVAAPAPALRVGVGMALAQYRLLPRLEGFSAAHPGMSVDLIHLENAARARTLDLDVVVQWDKAERFKASSTQRALFREHVFPVCHPRLLTPAGPLSDAALLRGMPLLHKETTDGNRGAEWSWSTWFELLGLGEAPAASMRFDNIATVLAAALQGQGVALARSLLVADALADGRLVRVLPEQWQLESSKMHTVRWPAVLAGDGRVRAFVRWLEQATAVGAQP